MVLAEMTLRVAAPATELLVVTARLVTVLRVVTARLVTVLRGAKVLRGETPEDTRVVLVMLEARSGSGPRVARPLVETETLASVRFRKTAILSTSAPCVRTMKHPTFRMTSSLTISIELPATSSRHSTKRTRKA